MGCKSIFYSWNVRFLCLLRHRWLGPNDTNLMSMPTSQAVEYRRLDDGLCFLSHAKLCDVGISGKLVKVLCNLGVCQIEQLPLIIVFHLFEDFVLHSGVSSKHMQMPVVDLWWWFLLSLRKCTGRFVSHGWMNSWFNWEQSLIYWRFLSHLTL